AGCSNQRIEQALTGSMNKIATLFHPKIYGGTMLLTLNSSSQRLSQKRGGIYLLILLILSNFFKS
ncbi:hypothetical protein, partial [Thiolapillus sp.]|uniref:hypothetical protein n=1 Tax=Thiolapillus sp. TaxID=2017437 RepID=UPI0025F19081